MRSIPRSILAVALAVTSAAGVAQDIINKNDLPDPRPTVDQSPINVGDLMVQGQGGIQGRPRINNALSTSTDTNIGSRTQNSASRDVLQQQTVVGASARPQVTSEFQKFVQESTGKLLPIFGAEFFANAPSTFAPVQNAPVPAEYPLGPGDEVLIRGWGTIDIDYRATIDRNGVVTLPTIGPVVLGGVKAGDADSIVQQAVSKIYKGVTLSVNFGQLRAITVYVVGQASRPGTYTVSSLSTLVTALFASGGPNANGSMRNVQVKRGGKTVANLDLYAFIAKGDKSADVKLQDGDTIYIPSSTGYIALTGKVNSPAIYELRDGKDSVEALLDIAGGLPIIADPKRAFIERIDPTTKQPRTVEQFEIAGDGLKKKLKNGDVLNVISITPDFANAVVLRGNVSQPVRAQFKSGMRVLDLIPTRDFLISRSAVLRQNSMTREQDNDISIAARIGSSADSINWDYAVIERINKADLSISLIPFNLGKIFENANSKDNVELQPNDTVTVFSQNDVMVPLEKRRVYVRIEGEVETPGVYQMSPGDNLHTLLAKAGGPTTNAYLFGTAFYREQVRKEQEVNLEKAATRLERQLSIEQAASVANSRGSTAADAQLAEVRRQSELQSVHDAIARLRQLKPTGRISFGLQPVERSFNRLPQLKLENGDKLVIPPRPDFIHVFGAVNIESSILWRPGISVENYLKSAGVRTEGDMDNVFVIRVDGSVIGDDSKGWFSGGVKSLEVMPGDSIVVPEKINKETAWSRFTVGLREWSQILANFGLGAAAIKTLK